MMVFRFFSLKLDLVMLIKKYILKIKSSSVGHLVSIYFGFLFLQQFLNNLLLCLIFFLKTILTFQSDNVVINVFTFYQWSIETLSIIINIWHVKNNLFELLYFFDNISLIMNYDYCLAYFWFCFITTEPWVIVKPVGYSWKHRL